MKKRVPDDKTLEELIAEADFSSDESFRKSAEALAKKHPELFTIDLYPSQMGGFEDEVGIGYQNIRLLEDTEVPKYEDAEQRERQMLGLDHTSEKKRLSGVRTLKDTLKRRRWAIDESYKKVARLRATPNRTPYAVLFENNSETFAQFIKILHEGIGSGKRKTVRTERISGSYKRKAGIEEIKLTIADETHTLPETFKSKEELIATLKKGYNSLSSKQSRAAKVAGKRRKTKVSIPNVSLIVDGETYTLYDLINENGL